MDEYLVEFDNWKNQIELEPNQIQLNDHIYELGSRPSWGETSKFFREWRDSDNTVPGFSCAIQVDDIPQLSMQTPYAIRYGGKHPDWSKGDTYLNHYHAWRLQHVVIEFRDDGIYCMLYFGAWID